MAYRTITSVRVTAEEDMVSCIHDEPLPGDLAKRLDVIEARFNACEPVVMAFVSEQGRFQRLRREAQSLLDRFPDPKIRPPLFGAVVGVKDIFHVRGFVTYAGSRLPSKVLQGEEAESVSRLKDAGALILGKTVTTEFAYFAPGPTRNPHNHKHTPGGSSSGSAAAVSAGLSDLALGTQTIGSIIRPAAFCGVVGLKPTYDRISREGVIPLAPSLDHVGLFAPDVATARLAASILYRDWREGINPDRMPILGIPDGSYLENASEEAMSDFQETCLGLARAGCEIRRVPALQDHAEISARHNLIVAAEAARVHAGWFQEFSHLYAPQTLELILRGKKVSEAELASALEGRSRLRVALTRLMDEHGIDLWISPSTTGPAPEGLHSTGDPVMNLPWTHAGLPAINLPTTKSRRGLPMGLQVIARWYYDEALLAWSKKLHDHVRR